MTLGDLCFFYHSGTKSRCVVGVVEVAREWYEDDDDEGEGEGAVDVKAVGEMRRFVDLKEMKGDKGIKDFVLFRQPRLSVVPVEVDVWQKICELGDGFSGDGDGISFSNTEETLTQAFSQYGRLLGVNVVMDKIRCRPKEFAYVKFSSKEEADEALLQLNGQLVDRRVVVMLSPEEEEEILVNLSLSIWRPRKGTTQSTSSRL
ncbi:multiple RNA-binding domain-containing protein 1-like [Raphanus sativus]|uniref:Multiple RNA-binding domain-containing protein 1-like n=1 Tax=Raphanus sativus TaxID=3726 RepID=A0A6J0JJ88_RAPSA|nr:multiple RNA-binding domain-containing protein 1-like [Raphanus sativus]XP_056844518.1 multiple RNA-binding domain-containing protein 1-like [Raphanus sativus]XP_056861154.1 multiple RNA-binding domain-containing protein 1-like [Raphanus sativus]XP_056861363.1 multiple RNA-binding domain-containing protein 1-like [Raphanus sativus]